MDASVIIPTRGRSRDLEHCLAALASQETARSHEVIVVDDGNVPALDPSLVAACPSARLVRARGGGPAAARNRGIAEAQGEVVLFTDDDTLPTPTWIEAACAFLESHPDAVGVEGPTDTPAYDELYAYSIWNDRPGAYWTCNVAYRKWVLDALDGFCRDFPSPHCEDLDLGFRAIRLGPIGFVEDMRVVHVPRPVTIGWLVRRSRLVASELVLFSRHPDRYASVVPRRFLPIAGWVRHYSRLVRRERGRLLRDPRRLTRLAVIATGTLALTITTLARIPRAESGA